MRIDGASRSAPTLAPGAPAPRPASEQLKSASAHDLSAEHFAQECVGGRAPEPNAGSGRDLIFDPAVVDSLIGSTHSNAGLESRHHESSPAWSIQDALDFRQTGLDAGNALADELIAMVSAAISDAKDPKVIEKLNGTLQSLNSFKEDIRERRSAEVNKAAQKRQEFARETDRVKQAQIVNEMMGGKLKKPFSIKCFNPSKILDAFLLRSLIVERGKAGAGFSDAPPLHLHASLAAHLSGIMSGSGLKDRVSQSALLKRISEHAATQVERRADWWKPVEREFALETRESDQTRQFTSRQTPARLINAELKHELGDRQGVSCMNATESKHAANVWKTEFSSPDRSVDFKAVRHGINDAYKIKDSAERVNASDKRTRDLLKTQLQSTPDRLVATGSEKDGAKVYELPMVSVSLVSPARLGPEAKMWEHQREAFARANTAEPFEATVELEPGRGPEKIYVKPKIIAVNTPVNHFALEANPLSTFLLGGWQNEEVDISSSITALIGSNRDQVGGMAQTRLEALKLEYNALIDKRANENDPDALDQLNATINQIDLRLARIKALAGQVHDIVTADSGSELSHHQAGNEPYKLPVRLAVLANELGVFVAFNCKSGKDRTGQLDTEIKAFYARMADNKGIPPEPNLLPTGAEQRNLATLFNEAGSLEIQKYNTSVPGSKVNLKVTQAQVLAGAGRDLKQDFKGLSPFVGS